MNNNISVLIADDNEDLAKELSSYIGAKPNMTVTAIATDGEEAYTLISQTRPDVIILDLVMPKLDGIGVLKRMQTLTFDKKPKIIVYSVSSIAIKMAASVSPLIDYCLLKPQSNERVYEVIQDLTSVPMVSAIPLSHNITAQKAEETDLETIVTDFIHELGVPAPTKWADLWDERLSGEILMQDSVRDAFMVALKKDGFSANSTDETELQQAKQDLIDQKPLIQAYVIDQVRDPDSEESWISDIMFKDTVQALTPRERRIIALRYLSGQTQMQVAQAIGISQAQVSRLEKNALGKIRKNIFPS